jgi:hypothetical protein
MSTYRELIAQRLNIENECFKLSKEAFNKLQDARVIHDENWRPDFDWRFPDEDTEDRLNPAQGYKFHEDEVTTNGICLNGYKYVGGGENYYVSIVVPFDCIDNLDLFIEERRVFYAAKAKKHREARQAYLAAQKIEQAEHDRLMYERLKTQFEGAAQ